MAATVRVRPPAVAGTFYPGRVDALVRTIDADLAAVGATAATETGRSGGDVADAGGGAPVQPKALVVPHAGYVYSGPVAATAYARLAPWRHTIRRVVLLGPAHRVPVESMALSSADAWETPLGAVLLDADLRDRVAALPGVVVDDRAHGPEHSLEVQVPFLQQVLDPGFTLLPVVVGQASHRAVARLLDEVWGGDETLIVVSTDLSHYHPDRTAKQLDAATAAAIVAGRLGDIGPYDACGAYPLRGLLAAADAHDLAVELVDLRTSADTAGDPSRVVGYGAFVLTPAGTAHPSADERAATTADERATTGTGDEATAAGAGAAASPDRHLDDQDRAVLLRVADEAIRAALEHRPAHLPATDDLSPALRRAGAAFVTLRDHGELLGCIGTIDPTRALVADVAANAVAAAFRDPRFPELGAERFARCDLHVSVLTPTEPLDVHSLDELARAVRPGVDGLLVEAGRRRGTFLPSVWEQLPAVDDFLTQLWRKAGLRPGTWPPDLRVWRYGVDEFEDAGPRAPVAVP